MNNDRLAEAVVKRANEALDALDCAGDDPAARCFVIADLIFEVRIDAYRVLMARLDDAQRELLRRLVPGIVQ